MKHPRLLGVVFCAIWLAGASVVLAAETETRLKVLLVTGGHGFQRDSFFDIFHDIPGITFAHAEHAKTNATVYERPDLLTHDVLVLYDMPKTITDRQKAGFLSLFEKGIGVVVLHHAIASYQDWPDYERIIGGRYEEPNPARPGTVTAQTGYEHDVDVPVKIVGGQHPITIDLGDFMIHDEIYWGFRVSSDVTPLITTTHPKSGKPLGWVRTEGKSRVVYLQPGHGPPAFNHPQYRTLIARSIRWTAGEPDERK